MLHEQRPVHRHRYVERKYVLQIAQVVSKRVIERAVDFVVVARRRVGASHREAIVRRAGTQRHERQENEARAEDERDFVAHVLPQYRCRQLAKQLADVENEVHDRKRSPQIFRARQLKLIADENRLQRITDPK